ncbi:hypothetical protein LG331_02945 [Vreelandella aquamarina]|uniref:hypothetical protein n=1 Tax=Vreelandella aquamarina TaxID=77097 RepID=UPI00384BF279
MEKAALALIAILLISGCSLGDKEKFSAGTCSGMVQPLDSMQRPRSALSKLMTANQHTLSIKIMPHPIKRGISPYQSLSTLKLIK